MTLDLYWVLEYSSQEVINVVTKQNNTMQESQFDIVTKMTNLQYELDYLRKIVVQDLSDEGEILNICISVKDKKVKAITDYIGDITYPKAAIINYQIPFEKDMMIKVVTALLRHKEDQLMKLDTKMKNTYAKVKVRAKNTKK